MNFKNILLISFAIIISSIIFTLGLTNNFGNKTGVVTVKGSAERYVVADKAIWNLSFVSAGNDLNIINSKIITDTEKVKEFFKNFGLTDKEITLGQLDFIDMDAREYKDPNQNNRFIITQTIIVETNNVNAIEEASKNLLNLIQENVYLKSSYELIKPVYLFTKLDDIKNEMIEEATQKAKKSAEQFAENSGSKVGKIKKANQGMFVISARNAVSQYSNDEIYQKDKQVRVVSTIDYYLK